MDTISFQMGFWLGSTITGIVIAFIAYCLIK